MKASHTRAGGRVPPKTAKPAEKATARPAKGPLAGVQATRKKLEMPKYKDRA